MKKERRNKRCRQKLVSVLTMMLLSTSMFVGCGTQTIEELENDKVSSENIIITETGEIIEIEGPEKVDVKEEELLCGKGEIADGAAGEVTASPEIVVTEPQLWEPEIEEQVVKETEQKEDEQDNKLQLVFLGDSIFDNNRDGTGIPYLTAIQCDAKVYNLAIGGTSATVEEGESVEIEKWTSRSLVGIIYVISDKISTDIFEGTNIKSMLDDSNVDFAKTDYFIIEYGLNDFFRGAKRIPEKHPYDMTTYVGALRFAVVNLRTLAPNATIILCAPNYAQFYEGNRMIGDGNIIDNGNGTLFDYKGSCEAVSSELNTLFLDAYGELGINGYTAEDFLEDGVHLTQAGRQLYADALAKLILEYEKTKNN